MRDARTGLRRRQGERGRAGRGGRRARTGDAAVPAAHDSSATPLPFFSNRRLEPQPASATGPKGNEGSPIISYVKQ
jgi:hypothetical protein